MIDHHDPTVDRLRTVGQFTVRELSVSGHAHHEAAVVYSRTWTLRVRPSSPTRCVVIVEYDLVTKLAVSVDRFTVTPAELLSRLAAHLGPNRLDVEQVELAVAAHRWLTVAVRGL